MKKLLLIVFLLTIGGNIQSDLFAKGDNENSASTTLNAVVVSVKNGVYCLYADGRVKTVAEVNNTGNRTFVVGEVIRILVVKPKAGTRAACCKQTHRGHVTVLK